MPRPEKKHEGGTLAAERKPRMPVIVRNVPSGHNWGWYSREDQRMHLQSTDDQHHYKVWLEENGKRIFEPVGKIPAKVLKPLRDNVAEHRLFVEDNWVRLMLVKDWLALHKAFPKITLIAYPDSPNKFVRAIDLRTWFSPKVLSTLTPDIIEFNRDLAALRLWTNRPEEQAFDARLSRLLWGNDL